jgi:hypothetical protein
MTRSLLATLLLLGAACGAEPENQPGDTTADPALETPADSAAVEAVREPGAVRAVDQRLEQAQRDADARAREGEAQVREAESTGTP